MNQTKFNITMAVTTYLCGSGKRQSPINFESEVAQAATLFSLQFNYQQTALKVLHNGWTLLANYKSDGSHCVMGVRLNHKNARGNLTGAMFTQGNQSNTLQQIQTITFNGINLINTVKSIASNALDILAQQQINNFKQYVCTNTRRVQEINWRSLLLSQK